MNRYEAIPHSLWRHQLTGQTASTYGACPYTSEADKANWKLEPAGFVIRDNSANTTGRRYPSFDTAESEANRLNAEYAQRVAAFRAQQVN